MNTENENTVMPQDNEEVSSPAKENTVPSKEKLSDSDVTTHTAALWKYNPIPNSPEPYPEYKADCEKHGNIEVTAARVRGKKHKHEGSNCDDWYDYAFMDGWFIATVSDGAGSKPLSRIGAKVSCEAALADLKDDLTRLRKEEPDIEKALAKPFDDPDFTAACSKLAVIVQGTIGTAFSAVEGAYLIRSENTEFEESLGRKPELKDYSGTLLAAAVIPLKTGETFIISIQLGDGMIASFNRDADMDSALRLLGNADSGGFAGETDFLTTEQMRTPDSLQSRTKIQRGKVSSLMLMTDGVADDYYPNSPQLLRLYIDLMLNGIIAFPDKKSGGESFDIKAAEPVSYPWVNDSEVTYSLQYAKNVMTENNIDLKRLWEERFGETVRKSSLESFGISNGKKKEERLSVWLDNYVERGSFDDRTLMVIDLNGGTK